MPELKIMSRKGVHYAKYQTSYLYIVHLNVSVGDTHTCTELQ